MTKLLHDLLSSLFVLASAAGVVATVIHLAGGVAAFAAHLAKLS